MEGEEEGVGEAQGEEEEELVKGQGDRSSWGLLGDEPRLQMERVSESSSDTMLLEPQASSSKFTDITESERHGTVTHVCVRSSQNKSDHRPELTGYFIRLHLKAADVISRHAVPLGTHATLPGAHGGASTSLVNLIGDDLQVPESPFIVSFSLRQFGLTLVHVLLQVLQC